jgi:hypothetical protein
MRWDSAAGSVLLSVVASTAGGNSAPSGIQTLEDIFGAGGNSFQGAIGFINFEGTTFSQPLRSYGLAVDDVVVSWREVTLVDDQASCTSGKCAVLEFATTNVFDGQAILALTLIETTPPAANDCDRDGAPDVPATTDCNGNSVPDLVLRAFSEVDQETVYLDRTGAPGGSEYAGTLILSLLGNSPGVLFVSQQGAAPATVTAEYFDADDGTGVPCPNHVDPSHHGFVTAATSVLIGATLEVLPVARRRTRQVEHGGRLLRPDGSGPAPGTETGAVPVRAGRSGQRAAVS